MGRTKMVAFTALMAGSSVLLTRFFSLRISIAGVEGIRIGFGSMPNIIAGIVLGPWYGAFSGAVADVVGFMLSPMGGYMPHFTLTSALMGFIPGMVFRMLPPREDLSNATAFRLAMSILSGMMIVSWGLTPYFLTSLFGLSWKVILPPRIVASFIELPVYTLMLKALYPKAVRLVPTMLPK